MAKVRRSSQHYVENEAWYNKWLLGIAFIIVIIGYMAK